MSTKLSPFKKFLILLKDATTLIILAISSFLFITSGLFTGLIFRYLDYNAGIIIFSSLVTESVALIILYFIFRGYLIDKEESENRDKDKNKK